MDAKDMQRRLEAISGFRGKPYGRVFEIFDAEKAYGLEATKFKGYLALSDAFKSFFLETVEKTNTDIRPRVKDPLSEFYALFLPRLVYAWQSLCGAERLALHGYALQAYSTLRNIFDSVQTLSAALQKFVDFYATEGLVTNQPLDVKKMRKLRKDTEYEACRLMSGSKSGLSKQTVDELARWDALFDFEVHGGRLSLAKTQEFMKGKEPLPIFPTFSEQEFAMFMNRYCEIAWMVHRLIPLIQPAGISFSEQWKAKWREIDEGFELVVSSLTKQVGKPIGAAIAEYVKAKFPFGPNSSFPF